MFYEYTYLMTALRYTLKKSSTNVILSCLLASKGKVLQAHHHSTSGLNMLKNVKFARESNYSGKELLAKKCLT